MEERKQGKCCVGNVNNRFIKFLIVLAVGMVFNQTYAAEYYVDINSGSNSNNGSSGSPWETIYYGLSQLSASDILHIKAGYYNETNDNYYYILSSKNNVQILGEPGVILDGSFIEFRTANQGNWVLYDAARKIYRSTKVFSYTVADCIGGNFKYNNQNYTFVKYTSYDDISSDSFCRDDSQPGMYVGPGIYYDYNCSRASNRYLYVRLAKTPQMTGDYANIPDDPNSLEMALSSWYPHWRLQGCSGVTIKDIVLKSMTIDLRETAHDITIENVAIENKYLMLNNYSYNINVIGCSFNNYLADWVAWHDCKTEFSDTGRRVARNYEMCGIGIVQYVHDVNIRNCSFSRYFDGIDVTYDTYNFNVNNCDFNLIRDDCIQLGSACYNVEINNNRMIKVASGVSRHGCYPLCGSCPQFGTKYIHHNIIDSSIMFLHDRPDENGDYPYTEGPYGDGKTWRSPFGHHGDITYFGSPTPDPDPWKIYNNTCIYGINFRGANIGCPEQIGADPDYPNEAYNNILVQLADGVMAIDGYTDGSTLINGNIYYREDASALEPLFRYWDKPLYSNEYYTFAAFQAGGSEPNGYYLDPKLDGFYATQLVEAESGIDVRYKGWPGLDVSMPHKGAVPVKGLRLRLEFDSDDTSVADNSGYANDGTVTGATPVYSGGILGKAIVLDGTSNYINLGNKADWDLAEVGHTFSAWIKTTASGWLFSRFAGGTPGEGYIVQVNTNGNIVFSERSTGTSIGLISNAGVADGNWHHIACVADIANNQAEIYVDGVLDNSAAFSGDLINCSSVSLAVGGRVGGLYLFSGSMDDVKIFRKALSVNQIKMLAHDQLYSYWKFDGDSQSTVYDATVNGNNGTLYNVDRSADGISNGCISGDGSGYVSMGNVSGYNLAATDHTFAIWFKTSSEGWLLARYAGGTPGAGYYITVNSTGTIFFGERATGDNISIVSGRSFNDAKWHHAVCTVDTAAKSARLYVDGILEGSCSYTGDLIDYDSVLTVSGRYFGYYFTGLIDEVRIYRKALGEAEIKFLQDQF